MDKSMTGDGAVVREDHARATAWAKTVVVGADKNAETNPIANICRAYLAQAAEIERLTRERDEAQREHTDMMWQRRRADDRAEASEARAAALLKALERLIEHCDNMESQNPDYHTEEGPCRSQPLMEADAARTAAKGETV